MASFASADRRLSVLDVPEPHRAGNYNSEYVPQSSLGSVATW